MYYLIWTTDIINSSNCFFEPPPDIIVLRDFVYNLQTLKDIYDVVNPSTFNFKLDHYFVQLKQYFFSLFKALDKSSA
jgi:hypothetical protein